MEYVEKVHQHMFVASSTGYEVLMNLVEQESLLSRQMFHYELATLLPLQTSNLEQEVGKRLTAGGWVPHPA